jgi:hypothetical protein
MSAYRTPIDYSKPATYAPVWLYAAQGVLWVYRRLPVRLE